MLEDGLSMIYSFYEPGQARRSLGTFMILDHIQRARTMGLPYLYLGYWVEGITEDGIQTPVRPPGTPYPRRLEDEPRTERRPPERTGHHLSGEPSEIDEHSASVKIIGRFSDIRHLYTTRASTNLMNGNHMASLTKQPSGSHFVDGRYIDDTDGAVIECVFPATGETIAQLHSATPRIIDASLDSAVRAQRDWAAVPPSTGAAFC